MYINTSEDLGGSDEIINIILIISKNMSVCTHDARARAHTHTHTHTHTFTHIITTGKHTPVRACETQIK